MSFFKELKEDIVQSVSELSDSIEEKVTDTDTEMENDEALKDEVQKEIDSILEDDNLLQDMTEAVETDYDESEESSLNEEEVEVESDEEEFEEEMDDEVDDIEETATETNSYAFYQEDNTMNEMDEVLDGSEETTVITKGTTINGGIKSDTSLIVKGVIEGDVDCQGKLTITGRVAGNSTASEIYVNTPRLEGSLNSRGSVKIDVGTVVIGSITSASVVVAGAVKGDIEVNGPIIVDSTAVVKGNIIGKSIQINSGAVIDGNCSLKYADVDLDSFFE
nr:polymer-forming cytoskeletal protein [Eubacterium sp.]